MNKKYGAKMLVALVIGSVTLGLSSANATVVQKTLVVTVGGMGTDGASLKSIPNKDSASQAARLYRALNVVPDEDGVKSAGVRVGDEIFGVICKQPDLGPGAVTGSCEVKSLSVINGPIESEMVHEQNTVVEFPPAVSKALFDALPLPKGKRPVGAVTKTAGNLSCTKVVYPGAKPNCSIHGVNAMTVSESAFSSSEIKELKKAAKLLGL